MVDAVGSGPAPRKGVKVRVLSAAPDDFVIACAGVVELVDTPDLGSGAREGVQVRDLSPALRDRGGMVDAPG